ncbi:putative dual-specificity RNA methyltransferase RlmN [Candidatus Sulfopaludibacter sp. SbA4]|nr:putative dual-specificity RNA methyltransferase RlmN [Candidatus Sulfopaludibacter sp. SbA4]
MVSCQKRCGLDPASRRRAAGPPHSFVTRSGRRALIGYTGNSMSQPLVGMDLADLREALGPSQPRYRAQQLYEAIYRGEASDFVQISTLPARMREDLAARHVLGLPEIARRYESLDGTRRYLLRLDDGRTVETVLMPEGERDTICISSQVGCPVDCKFCMTALLGLERSLTAGEIVGQVLLVARDIRLKKDRGLRREGGRLNIVMMGQGEPLLNLENVVKATGILLDPGGFGLSPRRITVSTAGIVPKIEELGREPVRPKLAISLNASTEESRRELMPITRKYHLTDLMAACRAYPLRPWEKLTFEYVLLKGVNDTDADARRVVKLLANLNCKVNLIALNPGPGIPYETPDPQRVAAFQEIVRRSMPCFVRKPRGLDIFAACGQLKRVEG